MEDYVLATRLGSNPEFREMIFKVVESVGGVEAFKNKKGAVDLDKLSEKILGIDDNYYKVASIVETESVKPLEVVGMRRDDTSVGEMNGAFVAARYHNRCFAVVFENGMDFINDEVRWKDVLNSKSEMDKKGWKEMTKEDIQKTSGLEY